MHNGELRLPEASGRLLYWAAGLLALATVVGLVVLWPDGSGQDELLDTGVVTEFYDARVVTANEVECPGGAQQLSRGRLIECAAYEFELVAGPEVGRIVPLEIADTAAGYGFSLGEKIVLAHDPDAPYEFQYSYADRQRKPHLFWLALIFAAAVVGLGGLRGMRALAGLAATLLLLIAFTFPAIIDGRNSLAVAIVSASAIAFVAIYLAHGLNPLTTVAVLGTLGALALTAVLGTIFTEITRITGFASEESSFLLVGGVEVDIQGLILAGIVIGALGAIDDMTVTQSAAVAEIHTANPKYGLRRLYRSANRIGQDHVASTVNTLVLAYAGASMPLLVLLSVSNQPLASVVNSELIATEVVRTLVGSIGLVAAVPLTTLLATYVVTRTPVAVDLQAESAGSSTE